MAAQRPSSSASPDGGSTGPIRRCTAFFEARGRVDHLEFFLGRGVLGLVGHRDPGRTQGDRDRKSTRLNSSHTVISYAVFCLKKKNTITRMLCTVLYGASS